MNGQQGCYLYILNQRGRWGWLAGSPSSSPRKTDEVQGPPSTGVTIGPTIGVRRRYWIRWVDPLITPSPPSHHLSSLGGGAVDVLNSGSDAKSCGRERGDGSDPFGCPGGRRSRSLWCSGAPGWGWVRRPVRRPSLPRTR